MTKLILQGGNLEYSAVEASAALDALMGKQSITHAHFPMFYEFNGDGSWKAIPLAHDTNPDHPWLPLTVANGVWKKGQLFLLTWGTQQLRGRVGMTAADITAGKYDAYLRRQAELAKRWAHPFIIALNPEFNGAWSSWYMPPSDFVAMWRHIVNAFRAVGADNVMWAWIPNQLSKPGDPGATAQDKLAPYYPGDEYVDYVGCDAYNWGQARGATAWLSLEQVMTGKDVSWLGDTYGEVTRISPNKPFILGEWGCDDRGGDKVAWLRDAVASIPRLFPSICIVSYYGLDMDGALWTLKESNGTAQAWREGIDAGPYARNLVLPPDGPLQQLHQVWGEQDGDLRKHIELLEQSLNEATMNWSDSVHENGLLRAKQQELVNMLDQARHDLLGLEAARNSFVSAFDGLRNWGVASVFRGRPNKVPFEAPVGVSEPDMAEPAYRGPIDGRMFDREPLGEKPDQVYRDQETGEPVYRGPIDGRMFDTRQRERSLTLR